jgi:hypothetical protein
MATIRAWLRASPTIRADLPRSAYRCQVSSTAGFPDRAMLRRATNWAVRRTATGAIHDAPRSRPTVRTSRTTPARPRMSADHAERPLMAALRDQRSQATGNQATRRSTIPIRSMADARRTDREHRSTAPPEPPNGPRVVHRRACPSIPHRTLDDQPHRDRPPPDHPRPPRHAGPSPQHDHR